MARYLTLDFAGQIGVNPRLGRMVTTDNFTTITAPGYLSNSPSAGSENILPTDLLFADYNGGTGFFSVKFNGGVISLIQPSTEGNVIGPVDSYTNAIALFADDTGKQIKTVGFEPVDNSLFGFNGTATPANITIGDGLDLTAGVLSANGAGSGDVLGPTSASIVGALTVFTNVNGKHIGEPAYSPAENSLVGYGTNNAIINITAGANVDISGGVISVESGVGNVTGSGTPVTHSLPMYTDTTGLAIQPSPIALTNGTILGVNGGALANITAGTGIAISGGTITATGAGLGTVTGPVGSVVAGALTVWDATNTEIKEPTFTPAANSLLGYPASGTAVANIIPDGTTVTVTDGVISSSGGISSPGDVTLNSLAVWDNINGKALSMPLAPATVNSLVGFIPGTSGQAIVNITAGANINISDSGEISASGGGGGGGNVTGPAESRDQGLALFSGTSGEFIDNPAYEPVPNSLVGYDAAGNVANITLGPGSLSIRTGILTSYVPIVNTPNSVVLDGSNNEANILISSNGARGVTLPPFASTPLGYKVMVSNLSSPGETVTVATPDMQLILYRNSSGDALETVSLNIEAFGTATFIFGGAAGGPVSANWQAFGDIV